MTSYVDSVLISGEAVLHRGRVSLWPLSPRIILGILLLPLLGIGLVLLVWAFVLYKTTEIAITNKRIIAKFGFIRRRTIEINLQKVESIQVEQNVPGRLFNYGTIVVAGAGTPNLSVPAIADPLRFRKHFMEATDTSQSSSDRLGRSRSPEFTGRAV
ncbi:MAG TPA: PH domain-containing protein [Burkholderiales bacterium]|nr:PH domain-containing protein [Burkholderiales bacterium]